MYIMNLLNQEAFYMHNLKLGTASWLMESHRLVELQQCQDRSVSDY